MEERYSKVRVRGPEALMVSIGSGVVGETSQVTRAAGVRTTVFMDSAMLSSCVMTRSHSFKDWRFGLEHILALPAWRIDLHKYGCYSSYGMGAVAVAFPPRIRT